MIPPVLKVVSLGLFSYVLKPSSPCLDENLSFEQDIDQAGKNLSRNKGFNEIKTLLYLSLFLCGKFLRRVGWMGVWNHQRFCPSIVIEKTLCQQNSRKNTLL